jgi:hypothetical protein
MNVKAAIALEPGQPLIVETVQLDGPKAGEVLIEIKATVIPMPIRYLGMIQRVYFRQFWVMKGRE